MLISRQQSGLTVIELLVGVAIVSGLLYLGANSFSGWTQNQRVRVAAEGLLSGLQIARAEAVRQNTPVQFLLVGGGAGWQVKTVATAVQVQARSSGEDRAGLVVTVTPAGATAVTFNGLGRVMPTNPLDGSVPISSLAVSNPNSDVPLAVNIGASGGSRMCDPNAPSGDPRRC